MSIKDHGGQFGGGGGISVPRFQIDNPTPNLTIPSFDTSYHRHDMAGKYLYHIISNNTNVSVTDLDASVLYANHTSPPFAMTSFKSDHNDEYVYSLNPYDSHKLVKVNKDLQIVWTAQVSLYQNNLGSLCLTKDHLYLMDAGQKVYKIDRQTGSILSSTQALAITGSPCLTVSLDENFLILSSVSTSATGAKFTILSSSNLSTVKTLDSTTPSSNTLYSLGALYLSGVLEFYTRNTSNNMWECHRYKESGTTLTHYRSEELGSGSPYAREYYNVLKVSNKKAILNMGHKFKHIQFDQNGGNIIKVDPILAGNYQKADKNRFYAIKVGGVLDYKGRTT